MGIFSKGSIKAEFGLDSVAILLLLGKLFRANGSGISMPKGASNIVTGIFTRAKFTNHKSMD